MACVRRDEGNRVGRLPAAEDGGRQSPRIRAQRADRRGGDSGGGQGQARFQGTQDGRVRNRMGAPSWGRSG